MFIIYLYTPDNGQPDGRIQRDCYNKLISLILIQLFCYTLIKPSLLYDGRKPTAFTYTTGCTTR